MKKSSVMMIAAVLMLSSCGTLTQLVTSGEQQKYQDGIYGNVPDFRTKEERKIIRTEAESLVAKTKESPVYLFGDKKDTIMIPDNYSATIRYDKAQGGTVVTVGENPYDWRNNINPWSCYTPYSIGSAWYWSRHYDPWYSLTWSFHNPWFHYGWHDPWYWGGWYDPWYWNSWYDPWYWRGWYDPWYPGRYWGWHHHHYCGWYGGWDPYWGYHHGPIFNGGGHNSRDRWYGPRYQAQGVTRTSGIASSSEGRTSSARKGIGTSSSSRRSTGVSSVSRGAPSQTRSASAATETRRAAYRKSASAGSSSGSSSYTRSSSGSSQSRSSYGTSQGRSSSSGSYNSSSSPSRSSGYSSGSSGGYSRGSSGGSYSGGRSGSSSSSRR